MSLMLAVLFMVAVGPVYAAGPVDTPETQSQAALAPEPEPKEVKGHSIAPIIGYEPTYKWVVGAAYFYEEPRLSFGIDANLNFRRVYQLHGRLSQKLFDRWEYRFLSGATQGFDPYYGEGGDTSPAAHTQLWGLRSETLLQILYQVSPILSAGVFGEVRVHTETADEQGRLERRFPNETTGSVGVISIVDTRRDKANSREGFMFINQATFVPRDFSTLHGVGDFVQLESSFIVYKEILSEVLPDVVAAFRVMGGHTFGTPSYMYRYRLGGTDKLPGYLENRFRGKHYYLQQTELRFPIWKMIGGAGFLGFGDASDGAFTDAKMAYGVGLRIGLPPNYVSKIRIDLGIGRDEQGIFADFGQTF
jgi:hypothetical protein